MNFNNCLEMFQKSFIKRSICQNQINFRPTITTVTETIELYHLELDNEKKKQERQQQKENSQDRTCFSA